MNAVIFLVLASIAAIAANSCISQNAYLTYLYRCEPEEFQELVMCVGSSEGLRPRLGARLTCPNKKRIIVHFSAISRIDPQLAACDRQPVAQPNKLDECMEECKLENMAGQCDSRVKCNVRLDELTCFDPNLHSTNDSFPSAAEFALRIQYICVDEAQRLEYMNEVNYNTDSVCHHSTASSPPPVLLAEASTAHFLTDERVLEVPTEFTPTGSKDESVLINGENGSSDAVFNDLAWTASFLSRNVEKWVLYLLLGLLLGLVLVLLLLLLLCCCSNKARNNKKLKIFNPNSRALNEKQNRESQTLTDAQSYAPRMIRFQRDSTLDNNQLLQPTHNSNSNSNMHQPTNTAKMVQPTGISPSHPNSSLSRASTGASAPMRRSMGWNRASDVPLNWPHPPAEAEDSQHPIYPKTPFPPGVVIANSKISNASDPSSNRQPSASSASLNGGKAEGRFVERDSVFVTENQPLLMPTSQNQARQFTPLSPGAHVWVRNSAGEGPEGINFYPSVSVSPVHQRHH